MKRLLLILALTLLAFFNVNSAEAAPPANFQTTLKIGSGLNEPSGFDIAPDGRIFILQRTGEVKIVKNGVLLPNNFVTLPTVATGDRGLIGIAFDPDFLTNHYVYFYYTDSDLHNKLVRFDASGDQISGSPLILYETVNQSFQLHVGGTVRFGPDGKIYLSIGDNGTSQNAQNLLSQHGKIIRLNPDGSIPSDNPFVGNVGVRTEIWAYGLRNPFRFQIDNTTGRMYAGDVGEATTEEINFIRAGKNYGWPNCEGPCNPTNISFVDPIYSYPHNGASAAAMTGPVYRGQLFPSDYQGRLFFGDYAKGFIKTMTLDSGGGNAGVSDFDLNAGSVVDMKTDPKDGSLYYLTIFPGKLYQVTYSTGIKVPTAASSASVTQGNAPLTVQFSSQGSADQSGLPLTYKWDFGDNTTSTDPNPTKTYTNNGKYTVNLTVSNGTYTALANPIFIQVGTPPTLTINAPADNSTYKAGDTISFSTSSNVPDSSISTNILFHHQTHVHPFLGPISGKSGQFTVPTTGEGSPDTWYEIIVTAKDGSGLTTTKSVSIKPLKSNITFASNFDGLKILLDGQPTLTPITVQGVINLLRQISTPYLQVLNNNLYSFRSWSDGGAFRHNVAAKETDTTYTANFDQTSAFKGEYFTNQSLSGSPALTRNDNLINFDWSAKSPDPVIPHDHYSVRWTKKQYFPQGRFTFTTASDDGNRLFVDGNLLIDGWRDQGLTTYSKDLDLSAGEHDLRIEFYQNAGGSEISFNWDYAATQPTPTPTPTPRPTQTPTPTPLPTPTPTPLPQTKLGGMNLDGYCRSIGQTGSTLSSGTWKCVPSASNIDMTQACIWQYNNQNAIAKQDVAGNPYTWSCYTSAGTPNPTPTPTPVTDYQAKFWNIDPKSKFPPEVPTITPTLSRTDQKIDFSWNALSPDPVITPNNFVAQWIKTISLSEGTYKLTVTSDDGSRVFIDNELLINSWSDHASKTVTAEKSLNSGNHTIRVEYYEHGGGAIMKFDFLRL